MPIGQAKFGLLGGVVDPGKLELIETKVADGTGTILDFTDLQESTYNVHFMTINNLQGIDSTASGVYTRLSNDSGTTFETSNYQRALQINSVENKTTSASFLNYIGAPVTNKTGRSTNCYIYFYNLGDSSKYSFSTEQSTAWTDGLAYQMHFGSSVYTVAETINAIRLYNASSRQFTGDVSLYGIAES